MYSCNMDKTKIYILKLIIVKFEKHYHLSRRSGKKYIDDIVCESNISSRILQLWVVTPQSGFMAKAHSTLHYNVASAVDISTAVHLVSQHFMAVSKHFGVGLSVCHRDEKSTRWLRWEFRLFAFNKTTVVLSSGLDRLFLKHKATEH